MESLVYVSRAKEDWICESELASLGMDCARRNSASGLTGVLFVVNGFFFQYLEGAKEDLERTFASIKFDPRHSEVEIMQKQTIERRSFPFWNMGAMELFERKTQTYARIVSLRLRFVNDPKLSCLQAVEYFCAP